MKGMKRRAGIGMVLATVVWAGSACATPQLRDVLAYDATLVAGQDGWYFDFQVNEASILSMQLLSGETGEPLFAVGDVQVEEGNGRISWDGRLSDNTYVTSGSYMMQINLLDQNEQETGERAMFPLHIFTDEAERSANVLDIHALEAEEVQAWDEASDTEWTEEPDEASYEIDDEEQGIPQATSFWDMNPDDYDLQNPEHQQAIWEIMMQPITVLQGDQTENIYITNQPGIKRTPYAENCAGELHGQSQGVHVLEADVDGYALIEAYTNDGTKTENSYMKSIAASRVQGYIKKSRLYQETPNAQYGLLVDKLRQKLYVFEQGKIISSLDVSTGLNTKNQPYNETPAGEFLTVSRVGDFQAGSRTIGRYAIRINGGTLLHEVLHDVAADGKTKIYDAYEPQLGSKASHGCIRIPRRKNAEGFNMAWFWENLPLKTKVIIWDDKGRKMYEPELPEDELQLYRNPKGGSNYHMDENCSGVKSEYLPLSGDLTYGELEDDAYKKLTPCVYCNAPQRKSVLYERYAAAAEQIGAEISEAAKVRFGVE